MSTIATPGAARRIIAILFVAQSIGSAALIANATVNPIVGATLSGRDALAGLPGTLLLVAGSLLAPTSAAVPGWRSPCS